MSEYDYAWRKDPGPMTFYKLKHEAIEACSPELYLRWSMASTLVEEMYLHGVLDQIVAGNRRDDRRHWGHLVEIQLVRAYLAERRAGVPPRRPGPPDGTGRLIADTRRSVERYSDEMRERARRPKPVNMDILALTVGSIAACCTSILAPENLKTVTAADAAELMRIYERILKVQGRAAGIE